MKDRPDIDLGTAVDAVFTEAQEREDRIIAWATIISVTIGIILGVAILVILRAYMGH